MKNKSNIELLQPQFTPVEGLLEDQPLSSEVNVVAGGSFKDREAKDFRNTGYVVHALEAALWTFHNTDSEHHFASTRLRVSSKSPASN